MRPVLALCALLSCGSSLAAAPTLLQARRAALDAVMQLPGPPVFCGHTVDARTDIVAFPAGRADRVYLNVLGIGRAYVLAGGHAQLVWCGKAVYQDAARWASTLPGNAARALADPFGTKWGQFPDERGGMDVFLDFAGTLTTSRINAAGKTVCSVVRGDPVNGEFRSAFQFGVRDTCP